MRPLACLLLCLSSLHGAPRPAPRPPRPKPAPLVAAHVGHWDMRWGAGTGRTVFTGLRERGGYSCHWGGTLWLGFWTLTGKVLTVWEWPADEAPRDEQDRPSWTVELDAGGLAGRVNGSADFPFALTAPRPDA